MGIEIPEWLKKSGNIVKGREERSILVEQRRNLQLLEQEKNYNEVCRQNVDRLLLEGESAIKLWNEMDVEGVMQGLYDLFRKINKSIEFLHQPVLVFKGNTQESGFTFDFNSKTILNKETALKEIIEAHKKTINSETCFDSIVQKIDTVWVTIEGQEGEGEHRYERRHKEDFLIINMQDNSISMSVPDGKKDIPFIKLVSFDNNPNSDDLKVAVDNHISEHLQNNLFF